MYQGLELNKLIDLISSKSIMRLRNRITMNVLMIIKYMNRR